jgi:hypothetical protein
MTKAANGSNVKVEYSLHHPTAEGSSPGTAAGTGRQKMAKSGIINWLAAVA